MTKLTALGRLLFWGCGYVQIHRIGRRACHAGSGSKRQNAEGHKGRSRTTHRFGLGTLAAVGTRSSSAHYTNVPDFDINA